jgi:hypothetical protein
VSQPELGSHLGLLVPGEALSLVLPKQLNYGLVHSIDKP